MGVAGDEVFDGKIRGKNKALEIKESQPCEVRLDLKINWVGKESETK